MEKESMYTFELKIEHPLEYVLTGKFEAPSPNWVHEDFPLIDYELFIITEGTLYISYHGVDYTVKSGEFLLLPPLPPPGNRRRGFRPSFCSFYWLHFACSHEVKVTEIPETQSDGSPLALHEQSLFIPKQAALPNSEKVLVLMRQLQDAVKTNYSRVIRNYMSTVILCELHSQIHDTSQLNFRNKKSQKQIYHDIIDFVTQNAANNLKVTDVAHHFGYNEKYLSHLFRTIAGIPLKQFILKGKMDLANFMLTDTNHSIGEIAASIGFSDSHHFAKAYKKINGLTPTEYRNAFSKRLLYHK
ncbi:helix-turn-helix transcriptional regulator [Clostridium sp. Marseille-P2415]|uniref:helix-turn-helix transcriptional regulator n=1 Tax=Clostridium sp. Marseille-P2415 TaxID=1805471 RepID=UPI00190E8FBD|nr:AraC family transcriptional regulator [Clostridium sp. Marseille-P2415]